MTCYAEKFAKLLPLVEKPARYAGGEYNVPSMDKPGALDLCMCFPDIYEIGMSNAGISLLYQIVNADPALVCERCFAPERDMAELLKSNGIPLLSIERRKPLKDFAAVGFSVQYELLLTNVLYMLDLAGIPFLAKDRDGSWPILIAGGPCAVNPEPFKAFFDVIVVGEGEEVLPEILHAIADGRRKGLDKREILSLCARFEGVYVPSLFKRGDRVLKAVLKDFEHAPDFTHPLVPAVEVVHDRASVELYRGCGSGCRFCQAGFFYRGIRERSADLCASAAVSIIKNTGFGELSLSSLSTGDYGALSRLYGLLERPAEDMRVKLSLPSLRLSSFLGAIAANARRAGLTFAPEAGTQRLRDVINKNVTEEEILSGVRAAREAGCGSVKLYFMLGLPTETDVDVAAIGELVRKIKDASAVPGGRRPFRISVSCAVFIPKPCTPFQWERQADIEETLRKQKILRESLRGIRGVTLSWHDALSSAIEGILARGDGRLSAVVAWAYSYGALFDGWSDRFRPEVWERALADEGLSLSDFNKEYRWEDELPWDFIDARVDRSYLWKEREKAYRGETTRNCREGCNLCGAQRTMRCVFVKKDDNAEI